MAAPAPSSPKQPVTEYQCEQGGGTVVHSTDPVDQFLQDTFGESADTCKGGKYDGSPIL